MTRARSTSQRMGSKALSGGRSEHSNKLQSFRVRLYSTFVLIISFAAIIYTGHVPLMGLIFSIQTIMVKELFQLAREAQRERRLPGFRAQQWYFYLVAAFWVYVRFIKNNLIVEITSSAALARLLGTMIRRHTLISYTLYAAGFVAFVLTLERGQYTYQFGQFAWTHMILMTVFLPSSFFVSNIFEGIIWFLLPCALVIVNDIAAYLAGFFFGRTPLIKLSPKKTWEGFIGGFIGTIVASWYLSGWMSRSSWLTCPRTDLSIWQPMECTEPPETFQPRDFDAMEIVGLFAEPKFIKRLQLLEAKLSSPVRERIDSFHVYAAPMQFHAVALALFASAIAPFGGFFASGFKRGFKIKDFGSSIPGHGGMTDRMDCQIVMALFSYIYYHAFTDRTLVTLGSVISMVVKLRPMDQLELLLRVANLLEASGLLPMSVVDAIASSRDAFVNGEGPPSIDSTPI
jgi:phosphatidate cytidylyltransferase